MSTRKYNFLYSHIILKNSKKAGKCMFFKKMLSKMKNFIVIKYRTESILDNIKVRIDDSISLGDKNNVSDSYNKINFSKIYCNRSL